MAMEKQEKTFPAMLHRMLTDIEEMAKNDPSMKSLQHVVSWQDHGKAFKVHDRKKFINVVMPTWFSRIKYTSWVRQLSSYGFQTVHTEGADKGVLYHDDCVRGRPELAMTIGKVKRTKAQARQSRREEGLFVAADPASSKKKAEKTSPRHGGVAILCEERGCHEQHGAPETQQDTLKELLWQPGQILQSQQDISSTTQDIFHGFANLVASIEMPSSTSGSTDIIPSLNYVDRVLETLGDTDMTGAITAWTASPSYFGDAVMSSMSHHQLHQPQQSKNIEDLNLGDFEICESFVPFPADQSLMGEIDRSFSDPHPSSRL